MPLTAVSIFSPFPAESVMSVADKSRMTIICAALQIITSTTSNVDGVFISLPLPSMKKAYQKAHFMLSFPIYPKMRCGKVAPSIVLSKTLAESLYHVMIKTWQRVTETEIVVRVIFWNIREFSIKSAFR